MNINIFSLAYLVVLLGDGADAHHRLIVVQAGSVATDNQGLLQEGQGQRPLAIFAARADGRKVVFSCRVNTRLSHLSDELRRGRSLPLEHVLAQGMVVLVRDAGDHLIGSATAPALLVTIFVGDAASEAIIVVVFRGSSWRRSVFLPVVLPAPLRLPPSGGALQTSSLRRARFFLTVTVTFSIGGRDRGISPRVLLYGCDWCFYCHVSRRRRRRKNHADVSFGLRLRSNANVFMTAPPIPNNARCSCCRCFLTGGGFYTSRLHHRHRPCPQPPTPQPSDVTITTAPIDSDRCVGGCPSKLHRRRCPLSRCSPGSFRKASSS